VNQNLKRRVLVNGPFGARELSGPDELAFCCELSDVSAKAANVHDHATDSEVAAERAEGVDIVTRVHGNIHVLARAAGNVVVGVAKRLKPRDGWDTALTVALEIIRARPALNPLTWNLNAGDGRKARIVVTGPQVDATLSTGESSNASLGTIAVLAGCRLAGYRADTPSGIARIGARYSEEPRRAVAIEGVCTWQVGTRSVVPAREEVTAIELNLARWAVPTDAAPTGELIETIKA
jgi:hypothetical protein